VLRIGKHIYHLKKGTVSALIAWQFADGFQIFHAIAYRLDNHDDGLIK